MTTQGPKRNHSSDEESDSVVISKIPLVRIKIITSNAITLVNSYFKNGRTRYDKATVENNARKKFPNESELKWFMKAFKEHFKVRLEQQDPKMIAYRLGRSRGYDCAKRNVPINEMLMLSRSKEFKEFAQVYIDAYTAGFKEGEEDRKLREKGVQPVLFRSTRTPEHKAKMQKILDAPRASPAPVTASTQLPAAAYSSDQIRSAEALLRLIPDADEYILVSTAKVTALFDTLKKVNQASRTPLSSKKRLRQSM